MPSGAPRLEPLKPASLDADQRRLYDAVLDSLNLRFPKVSKQRRKEIFKIRESLEND